jgi:hypothetical protein
MLYDPFNNLLCADLNICCDSLNFEFETVNLNLINNGLAFLTIKNIAFFELIRYQCSLCSMYVLFTDSRNTIMSSSQRIRSSSFIGLDQIFFIRFKISFLSYRFTNLDK